MVAGMKANIGDRVAYEILGRRMRTLIQYNGKVEIIRWIIR